MDRLNFPVTCRSCRCPGDLDDTSIEALVALKPDVVVLGVSARVIDRLEGLGLKVVALEPKSMNDVQRVLGKMGQILGKEDDARRLWNRVDGHIAQSAATLPPGARGLRRPLPGRRRPPAARARHPSWARS